MDRTVRKVVRRTLDGDVKTEPNPAEKLLKYFPEAALALYITLDPMVREATHGAALKVFLWGTLAVSVAFCWLYLGKFWNVPANRQRWFSMGALVLYVAAIGGPFLTISGYKTIYGSIAAAITTAFLIFVPSKEVPSPPPAN
jgi:hypothetical protein